MKKYAHTQKTGNKAVMPAVEAVGQNGGGKLRGYTNLPALRKINNAAADNGIAQLKPYMQVKNAEGGTVNDAISNQIKDSNGKGSPLPEATKSFMENRFGADFSQVNIHTGGDAEAMSAELGAQAFTVGKDIYFNSGRYAPEAAEGKRLLAHELTHVVQQGNSESQVQRAPVEGTQSSSKNYRLDGWDEKQVQSAGNSPFPDAKLSYDEAASTFTVTFSLVWVFPNNWNNAQRQTYVSEFESSVRTGWESKFRLKEKGSNRKANVKIGFDENIVLQQPNAYAEWTEANKLLQSKQAWLMDTRVVDVRDNVSGRTVNLDKDANKGTSRKVKDVKAGAGFSIDDGNDNQTIRQNTSAHEFGHMIGLGDEYLNDSGTLPANIDASRGHVNDRIMNIGSRVTKDVYAPFADWLSALTGKTWIVE